MSGEGRKSRQGGIFLSVSPRPLQHRNPTPAQARKQSRGVLRRWVWRVRSRAGLSPGSRGVSQILGRTHICVCFLVQEEPSTASGRQDRAETTRADCAFCLRLLQWWGLPAAKFPGWVGARPGIVTPVRVGINHSEGTHSEGAERPAATSQGTEAQTSGLNTETALSLNWQIP